MKKKLIVVFIVFIAIGLGLFYLLTRGNIGVKYDTASVIKGEVGLYVEDVGRISSKKIRRYYGNGLDEVEVMPLKLGDRVVKGQVLVKYENDAALDLEVIDLNKDILKLEVQKVEKQIVALEAAYEDAQTGTDMESVNSARVEIARIQSQIESATKAYERNEALFNEGIVTLVEFEQSAQSIHDLESGLSIARNTYKQLAKGISDSTLKKYETDIDALLLSIEVLEKNMAILDKNKEAIEEKTTIYADMDGIVTELNTYVGDKPSAGTLMVQLHDPTDKIVLVDFMVEDAMKVTSGLTGEIQDLGLDISIPNLEVTMVYPNAFVSLSELGVEENRQTVELGLGTSAESLPFGLELATRVMITPPRETLLVPAATVVTYDGKQMVQVLEDGSPVDRVITTGIEINGKIEVIDGLEEGEQVIVNYQAD